MKPLPWWVPVVAALLIGAGGGYIAGQQAPVETVAEASTNDDEMRELRAKYEAAISESNTWRQLAEKRTKTTRTPVLLGCDGGAPVIANKEESETHEKTQTEEDAERQRFEKAVADEVAKRQQEATSLSTSKPALSRYRLGLLGGGVGTIADGVSPGGGITGGVRLGDLPVFLDGAIIGAGKAAPTGEPTVIVGGMLGVSVELK